jgi:hypothetical protein
MLSVLPLSPVTTGSTGERMVSSLGCAGNHDRLAIAASAKSIWSLAV